MTSAARFRFLHHPLPLAFAHRGGGAEREENTLAAFAHAVGLGFRYIETDVQASRDGVAVIHHDATLERSCGRPERIGDLPWAELARMRTRRGEALPRLDAVLAAFPTTRFNLDAKVEAAVAPIAEAVGRAGALDRVCVGSFDPRRTWRLRRLLGGGVAWSPARAGIAGLWLAGWGLPVPGLRFPAAQIPPAHRGIALATPRVLAAAHRRGIQVHVWTVDDPAEMERLLDLGVDGLMTGRPGLLKAVLQRRGQWH